MTLSPLLLNKTAIVTGATSGIGKAIALLFLQHGAYVVGVGTNAEKGASLLSEASSKGFGDHLIFERCDISVPQNIEGLFSRFFLKFPSIDILVNNAGITKDMLLMRMSYEDWHKVLDVNLSSCF